MLPVKRWSRRSGTMWISCQAEVHLNWVDLLAYLGTRYGGDFSRYKKSDMKKGGGTADQW